MVNAFVTQTYKHFQFVEDPRVNRGANYPLMELILMLKQAHPEWGCAEVASDRLGFTADDALSDPEERISQPRITRQQYQLADRCFCRRAIRRASSV
jgi:hypothetical protein